MKKLFLFLMLFVGLIFTGCSHPLRITNADNYFAPPLPPRSEPLKLGITSGNVADPQNSRYINSIVEALQRSGNFEKVIYPYSQAIHKDQINIVLILLWFPITMARGSTFL